MGFIFRKDGQITPSEIPTKTVDGLFKFEGKDSLNGHVLNGNIIINGIEIDNLGLKWFYESYTKGFHLSAINDLFDIWSLVEIEKNLPNKPNFDEKCFYFADVCIGSYELLFKLKNGEYSVVADCGPNGMKELAKTPLDFIEKLQTNWHDIL